MSATDAHGQGHQHGHEHGHDHHGEHGHHDDHADHGSLKGYLTGFGLSILLTAIPFWVVMADVFRSTTTAAVVVLVFGVVQIYVHMIYFLHMNSKAEQGWTMLSMIFTVVLVLITLGGSFWVMFHLNSNMMPMADPTHETMTSTPR